MFVWIKNLSLIADAICGIPLPPAVSASYPGEIALGCGIAAGSNELGLSDAFRRLFRRRHLQRVSAFLPKERGTFLLHSAGVFLMG